LARWEAATAARADLERTLRTSIRLPSTAAGGRSGRVELDRVTFEAMTGDLVDRCVHLVEQATADAGVAGGASHLDLVVTVGSATRMPAIRRRLAELTGKRPLTAINPEQVVVLGAATQAAILAGQV
jgi:molecular chaperone DnaK